MSNFQIIEQQDGRFALYQGGVLINTYSRKDSAVRRLKKLQSADVFAPNQETESELNFVCRAVGESFYALNQVFSLLGAPKYAVKGVAQPHALTQRVERGAERGVARSPPLG